jgi:hypothetical protein
MSSQTSKKLTEKEIQQAKSERMMNAVIRRASYYRANPHRFVTELLGIHLKLFQKILIYAMMHYDYFFFIASRGLGKQKSFYYFSFLIYLRSDINE